MRSGSGWPAGLAVATALALAGCSTGPAPISAGGPAGEPGKGGTVRVLSSTAFSHLDPAQGFDAGVNNFYRLVYRTLTTQRAAPGKAGTEVVPDLATDTGRPSDGGRTWTFTLRKGPRFQNGKAITSADVKFGISRAWDPEIGIGSPYAKQLIAAPKGYRGPYRSKGSSPRIDTPDSRTVVFHLKQSYADFGSAVAQPVFTPFPRGTGARSEFDKQPIASGPYQVAAYEAGARIKLVRNKFWSEATDEVRTARPDGFEWTFGLDPATIDERMLSARGEDVNAIADAIQPATISRIQDKETRRRTLSGLMGCTTYMSLNTKKGKLGDVRVRRALNYAVNKQSIVNAFGGATKADPATSIQPPTISGRKGTDLYATDGQRGDLDKARKLLKSAGVSKGFSLTLDTREAPVMRATAEALQQSLAPLGIKVKVNIIDTATFYEVIASPAQQHDAAVTGWCPDWAAGITFLPPLFDGRNIVSKGNQNLAQLNDPGINAAIDRASALKDVDEQNDAFGALDAKIMRDAPIVPLVYEKSVNLVGGNIAGAYKHPVLAGGIDFVSVGLADPDRRA
ncbi:ABC transporter substrate-binding protein [Streptomyces iconiensis]|uniref:ABC transporter substrate-binding protein n=1 Tax=Streptomyces iconiensis TaxID=1384038 RepID=A0ABT7A0S2_9ACTN|nr:ABC transporter substrate-binding protein [Streptomyces iconiensis]MDJ1134933.1 ABC transporter substrate-binding protein [Streptomyces iconiensis]